MKKAFSPALAAALLAAALGAGAAAAQEAPPEATPAVRSPGNAQWAQTADEARQRAGAQGKYVFYEFDGPSCGNCRRMEALLYPAFDFEALLIPMVPVKISLASAQGKELANRYGISDTPAILITTAEGRVVFQMVGFTSTQDFYPHVRTDLDEYRKFEARIQAQDLAHLSAAEALDTGRELYRRSDAANALPRLKRAVSAPDATRTIRDDARDTLAAAQLDLGQIAASRATTEKLLQTTQDGLRRQRAELFRAQLPLAENKPDDAIALFRKFLKDHPESPYRKQVNETLEHLKESAARP